VANISGVDDEVDGLVSWQRAMKPKKRSCCDLKKTVGISAHHAFNAFRLVKYVVSLA
jgi:hypothetical protein